MKIVSLRQWAALAVGVLMLAGSASLRAQVVTKILDQGSNATHINVVMFSEGYTSAELVSKFPADAKTRLDAFFAASPYSEYQSYFNVYTIAVASNQSGSDHYTPATTLKDTYFNSSFDSYGLQRLLTIAPNDHDTNYADGQGKIDTLLMNYVPDYDLVIVVVNDPVYGGSGGGTSVASTNTSSVEILIHESGHSFGLLGDEYGDAYPGYPDTEEPNTTTQTQRSLIKWGAWILASTAIPTPDVAANSGVIGLFEGAHYHFTGWYRPKQNCRMRSLGVDFCEVCSEALVLSVYRAVRPIDSFLPTNLGVTSARGAKLTFSVVKKTPATHSLAVQWSVDGTPVVGATNDQFSTTNLGIGSHKVGVVVSDPTALVRTDTAGLLQQSKTWTVQITAAASVPIITSATSATAQVGQPFSYQIGTQANDATSYGAQGLPAGLSVNTATGAITGTPTAAGSFSVGLSATNAAGTGSATLTLAVAEAAAPAPVITSATALSVTAGQPVSYQIAASGTPMGFGASGLPLGVGIDTASGLISGVPTIPSVYAVTLSATNAGGTGTAGLTLTVAPAPGAPVFDEPSIIDARMGQSVSFQLVASGSPTSYEAHGLPDGCSVDPASGLVTGTPSVAGVFTVSAVATNASGTGYVRFLLNVTEEAIVSVVASVAQITTGDGLTGQFLLTRTGDLSQDLFVFYTVKGSALAGTDYVLLKGRAKIKAGKATKVIKVAPLGDLGGSGKKTVKVTLQTGEDYLPGNPATAKVKILAGPTGS